MRNFICIISFILCNSFVFSQQLYKEKQTLMGCTFDITVVAKNQHLATSYIQLAAQEIKRIELLISSWDVNSQTSKINRNAGILPVKVDIELYKLIERAIQISKLTDGAFDISYASMDRIWKFDGSMKSMPSKEKINKSVEKVGYHNILLDSKKNTVFLKLKGMKIGFGAIGKGYAADNAKKLLIKKGVIAGIINASGDMNTWGGKPDGSDWDVGITNPLNKDKVFAVLPLTNKAIVTSGNYEKYVEFDNKRYSHIIDPRTGYPSSGIASVSVFAPSAELADALATSIFVMGIETGIDRVQQLKGIACIIVDDKGKVHSSENINIKNNH